MTLAQPFTPAERAIWLPNESLMGVEWAERYIRIPERGNAEPGPIRLARTPYWAEPLNKACDEFTQYIDICAGVQTGKSQTTRNALGYWVDNWAGDDILLVYPTERSTGEQLKTKLQPLIEDTPRLARWMTGHRNQFTKDAIALSHLTIWPGWSGSPQTTASRSCRGVIVDEADKAQRIAVEASTAELADARTTTYMDRRKVVKASTPTSRDGETWAAWDTCPDRRRWHVPCPHCGVYILLTWEQVTWEGQEEDDPKKLLAQLAEIDNGTLEPRYVCQECGDSFGERERMQIQSGGVWVREGFDPGAELPPSIRVAYHMPSINSPWVSFARLVGVFLKCCLRGDMHYFLNNYLALPFEDSERSVDGSVFLERAEHAPRVAPNWATCVVAGADTQKDSFPFVIRAWGPGKGGLRSRLIDFGEVYSLAELRERCLDVSFPVEDRPGHFIKPGVLMIDSGGGVELEAADGTTRDLVYQFALSDPTRVVPVKGYGGTKAPDTLIKTSQIKYSSRASARDPRNVTLQILDTQGLKDKLSYLIRCSEPVLWEESTAVNEDYCTQMSSEAKTSVKVGSSWRLRWKQKTASTPNHIWDASVYSLAGAMLLRADKRSPEIERRIKAAPRPSPPKHNAPARTRQPQRRGGGWIAKRPRR